MREIRPSGSEGGGTESNRFFDRNSNRFTGSSPRVIEKQQQGVITLAKFAPAIRRLKKCVDFLLFQRRNWGSPRSFEWNIANLCAPFRMLGAEVPRIPSESMERGKPLISSGNGTTSSLFQVREKLQNDIGRKVVDHELIDVCFAVRGDERQEQTESIAIALLSVS